MEKLGDRIKKLRLEYNWTQEELAKRINATNKQVISNWERNIAKPELKHLVALAKAFRINSDYLLGLDKRVRFMHPQGGEHDRRGKHWDWVFQSSYDLIEVINSDYRFRLNNRYLDKKDKEFITFYIKDLYKKIESIRVEYEEQIHDLEKEIDELKGIKQTDLTNPLF
ncbi:helix-turn-helix domain-containing protein [Fredinandcohnia salidurans]|uniref:Helix-turn-helix domain-containing protein n=1 Tax=Fredinandcohnia salidurans TaxID=2595041 RepID=A0ABW4MS45_9BACI